MPVISARFGLAIVVLCSLIDTIYVVAELGETGCPLGVSPRSLLSRWLWQPVGEKEHWSDPSPSKTLCTRRPRMSCYSPTIGLVYLACGKLSAKSVSRVSLFH